MSRQDVIDYLLETGLLRKCIDYQFFKMNMTDYKEDFYQDMWVWVMTYDEDKLVHAFTNKHLNALITRVIQNNIKSVNSPFYRDYKKWDNLKTEITDDFNDIVDE